MISIRKATDKDAERIARIHADAWSAAYCGFVPADFFNNQADFESRLKMWNKFLSEKHDSHYVVEISGNIIGFFSIDKPRDTDLPESTYELVAIYFAPGCWHKGYGRQAMRFIIDRVKKLHYNRICLWVLQENTNAIEFYKSLGFQFDGTTNVLNLGKPVTECRYQLLLDGSSI